MIALTFIFIFTLFGIVIYHITTFDLTSENLFSPESEPTIPKIYQPSYDLDSELNKTFNLFDDDSRSSFYFMAKFFSDHSATYIGSGCSEYEKLELIEYTFNDKDGINITFIKCIKLSNEEIIIIQNQKIIELLENQTKSQNTKMEIRN